MEVMHHAVLVYISHGDALIQTDVIKSEWQGKVKA